MHPAVRPRHVIVKGLVLFALFEWIFLALPLDLGWLNLYRGPLLARQRFPTSTHPSTDAALDVGNLDAMFASHILARPKAADELRVLVLGDSAIWGFLLQPQETLPAQLDALGLTCNGKRLRFYNLSYPRSSATKDLMILDKALSYQPDMVVWMLTLYTLMPKTRLDHWLITQNPDEFYRLDERFHFLPQNYPRPTLLDRIAAKHRALFRVLRYQLYAPLHLATGTDQIQEQYEVVPRVLSDDLTFEGLRPPTLSKKQLSLDQVEDLHQLAGRMPLLLVNQPILILQDVPNSDLRYNAYYPRWVYDQYREHLGQAAEQEHWRYLDLWDLFPPSYFTNTPLHLNPQGERLLAQAMAPFILQACP